MDVNDAALGDVRSGTEMLDGGLAGLHMVLYLPDLTGGGLGRMRLMLAQEFRRRGANVVLIVNHARGELIGAVPSHLRIVELLGQHDAARGWRRGAVLGNEELGAIWALTRYLRANKPDVLIAAGIVCGMRASWAHRLAGGATRLIVSQHIPFSDAMSTRFGRHGVRRRGRAQQVLRGWVWRRIGWVYKHASGVVAVSIGVADDLATSIGLPRERITVIHNPVVDETLSARAERPVDHPWFCPGQPPVVLGVGHLSPVKDFSTLLRAFARLRGERVVRLVILGEGEERPKLQALALSLGVAADVDLPGFVADPYPYYARAGVFALTSRLEGFGNVLVEALACGCAVVSTDCPSGPAEILDGGRFGHLMPVGDAAAIADALAATLDRAPRRAELSARGFSFSVEKATNAYLEVLGLNY